MIADVSIQRVDTIAIELTPHTWPFATDEAARIDAHWTRLRNDKPGLFDGRVLLAHALAIEGGQLGGQCFETRYSAFLSWRDFGFPDRSVWNLFAMPALRAADGAFMLGEMSASTANAGRLYFPAGTPEPSDVSPNGFVDYNGNILRELEEETGLAAAEVTLGVDWTIVSAGPLVACMKVAQSALSAADLQERLAAFNALQARPELTRLVPVYRPDDFDGTRMPEFMLRYLSDRFAQT